MTSGNSLKYTGNYDGSGSVNISFPGATNPFLIAKTSDIASGVAGASATGGSASMTAVSLSVLRLASMGFTPSR